MNPTMAGLSGDRYATKAENHEAESLTPQTLTPLIGEADGFQSLHP